MKHSAKIAHGVAVALLLTLGTSAAQESCRKPEADIVIPDGEAATKDQMIDAQAKVNTFLDKMNGYLECLDERNGALPADESGNRARIINEARYRAALDEMQGLAEKFNLQVRVYKLRSERPD
ncbi:MAG: hypothetical protein AAFX85_17050 [Pseudomonadota bacterium]